MSGSAEDLEGDDIWGDGDAPAPPGGGGSEGNNKDENATSAAEAGDVPPPPPPAEAAAEAAAQDVTMESLEDEETRHMSVNELRQRIHLLQNDIRIMKSDVNRLNHESQSQKQRIKENLEKVKVNKQLPYLVANVVEVLEPNAEDGTL
jgi:TolA-binding protein